MRTIVYIDGFNLYYGALKYTEYKWLDIYKLFNNVVCHSINGNLSEVKIKYFTANVLGSLANSTNAVKNQNLYHNALRQLYSDKIEIIKGEFLKVRINAKLADKIPGYAKDEISVIRPEEKQTDVNIALSMYRDVSKRLCEQVILCSNDTDLVPALSALREDFSDINIGVVFPLKEKSHRPASKQFKQYSNWEWKHLSNNDLQKSQLPDIIPTKKKPIIKPEDW